MYIYIIIHRRQRLITCDIIGEIRQNEQSSIDISVDPGLKLYQITFPCAQSVTAAIVTIV
jgi:hypothetical protein